MLDALAPDDIDTDCNGVITMADLTVTMITTRRRPLSQEEIEALIDLRIAQLRVLAAQTAVEWWRSRERERDERIRRLPFDEGAIMGVRGRPVAWNNWYSTERWAHIRRHQLLTHPLWRSASNAARRLRMLPAAAPSAMKERLCTKTSQQSPPARRRQQRRLTTIRAPNIAHEKRPHRCRCGPSYLTRSVLSVCPVSS